MPAEAYLILYCIVILLASLAGGAVPMIVRLTHKRMQVAISLVAGFMLGVGLLHLLPDAIENLSVRHAVPWLLVGLLTMFFIERFFCFHHHDAPGEADDGAHEHDDETVNTGSGLAQEFRAHHVHKLTWSGVAVGLVLHSTIAGVALAAKLKSDTAGDIAAWPGVAVFIGIVLHKPFDSMTLLTLMSAGTWSTRARHLVNAIFALAVPMGAVLFFLGTSVMGDTWFLGVALAFSTGVFLCVSLSDLLPELHFHTHDRIKLSVALLLGLALSWMVGLGHAHEHEHGNAHKHDALPHVQHDHDEEPAPITSAD